MTFNKLKYSRIIAACALTAVSSVFTSCDYIDEDDRYMIIDPVKPERVVLLEDFTGQNCVNCPDAHTVIEGLQEQYGDAVIAVSIHGGAFSISRGRTSFDAGYIGLGTPEGEHYNTLFNISSWPKGMINRRNGVSDYADWATIVRSELERPTDLAISLEAGVVDSDNGLKTIEMEIDLIPQEDIEKCYLQVWILESGIVARQRSESKGLITDYVHNNVLRAAVNGEDGEMIELKRGLHESYTYTMEVRDNEQERWNVDQLSVVAFVRSESGVHQAAIVRIENN